MKRFRFFSSPEQGDPKLARDLREPTESQESGPERRSRAPLDFWWLDVKLGVRMLIKYPGLALVGVFGVTVAVAIAVGVFSAISNNFLNPVLPLDEGDRIVSLEIWDLKASEPEQRILHDYNNWREDLTSMEEIGAFRTITPNLIAPGAQPESVRAAAMSSSGFSIARVRPLMGRYLTSEDERERAPSVIVIGENVWRNRFGSDPAILEKTIQLGATPHRIVGVMPAGFAFPVNHHLWVPLRTGVPPPVPLTGQKVMVFGRLRPGATLESAQAELTAVARRRAVAFPKIYAHLRPQVLPYPHPFVGLHQTTDLAGLHMLNGVVTTLLALICVNVAILVYTRTVTRQAEISVRTALGASRGRIVAQLFIEALVLSTIAAVAGVAIAELALRQVASATLHIASELPFWLSLHLSPGAVLYAVALSVFAAAIIGIVPALKATKTGLHAGVRVVGGGNSGMRLGGIWTTLVVAQVGFAVALLPGAAFAVWENLRAEFANPGIAANEFLTARLMIDNLESADTGLTRTEEPAGQAALRQAELVRRLQDQPQVSSVTFAASIPGEEPAALIETEGVAARPRVPGEAGAHTRESNPPAGATSGHEVRFNRVDVSFFRTLDVPILAGRGFEQADVAPVDAGSPHRREGGVIVVNQSLAQRLFGGAALGRRIRYVHGRIEPAAQNAASGDWHEIVGIVRDFPAGISPGMLDSPLRMYHPVGIGQVLPVNLMAHVRGGTPSTFSRSLLQIAASVDPDLQLQNIVSLDQALRREHWIRRLEAAILAGIAFTVVTLSAAGIYAMMSFTVSQRRKEIGIRMALGADRARIVASIFSRAFGQLAAGAALGVASAIALETASDDSIMRGNAWIVVPAVALFMMAVGLAAAAAPSRNCLAIEPVDALRDG